MHVGKPWRKLSMQNTNDLWLGSVPDEWQSFRIKDVAQLSPGFSDGTPELTELCTVVPMEAVSEKGTIDTNDIKEYDLITSGLTKFEVGDVIFAEITPCIENGKGAFVEKLPTKYAFGSTEFHVLRLGHKADGRFFYYYTYNSVYRDYAEANMTGVARQKRVSSRFINYTRIFLPVLTEQRLIAAYLDKTCAAIDAAIEAKGRQLELLDALRKSIIHKAVTRGLDDSVELKDSGVEWIRLIPIHLRCEHLKRVSLKIQTGTTPPTENTEYYVDGTIPWFAPGCYDKGIYLEEPAKLINELAYHDNKLRLFPAQSIFLVGIGATIGKVAMTKTEASCNQQITGIVIRPEVSPKYMAYQMKIYEDIIPYISKYTTLPIMDQVKIGYLRVALPPRVEQEIIANYLDDKMQQITKLESSLQNQISSLEGYCKSLIHECVTGKRRITEDDLKD